MRTQDPGSRTPRPATAGHETQDPGTKIQDPKTWDPGALNIEK